MCGDYLYLHCVSLCDIKSTVHEFRMYIFFCIYVYIYIYIYIQYVFWEMARAMLNPRTVWVFCICDAYVVNDASDSGDIVRYLCFHLKNTWLNFQQFSWLASIDPTAIFLVRLLACPSTKVITKHTKNGIQSTGACCMKGSPLFPCSKGMARLDDHRSMTMNRFSNFVQIKGVVCTWVFLPSLMFGKISGFTPCVHHLSAST